MLHVKISPVCAATFQWTCPLQIGSLAFRTASVPHLWARHFCIISLKLFGVNTPEVPHLATASITRVRAFSFTQPDEHVCHSFKTTKCYLAVSWLWTRSRYVLISCNLLEMLVQGVKRRGGGRGGWGGRAGRRVFLVKGNGARCRRGFPSPNMCSDG